MGGTHVCVWLDRFQARLFEVPLRNGEPSPPPHKVVRENGDLGPRNGPADERFLEEIAVRLETAHGILIAGPGRARMELSDHLYRCHPHIHDNIWSIQMMNHLSDRGIAATAREFFRTAVRRHD